MNYRPIGRRNWILLILSIFGLALTQCRQAAAAEVHLYLLPDLLYIQLPDDLTQLVLPAEPILTMADIEWYDAADHRLKLGVGVASRFEALELPGKPFVLTVNDQPIYAGEFMAAYFSRSSNGAVILWPTMDGQEDVIQIQLGYPAGFEFFQGEDPRSNPDLLDALRQADKLR